MDWPKDSRKGDYYINEEGMYELDFESRQPRAENVRKHCCKVMFPQIRQQLTSKMKEDHQQAIEEKDTALALLTEDLQGRDNQIQAIQYENVALQAQRDVHQTQLQRCQDTIILLRTRYFLHAKDLGKANIIIILRKHTSANDKYHDLPYYVTRIQRHKRYVKLIWLDQHFPDHEVTVEINNPNSIHVLSRFEEEGHAKRKYNHFRLIDLTREELYAMRVPTILDDEEK